MDEGVKTQGMRNGMEEKEWQEELHCLDDV